MFQTIEAAFTLLSEGVSSMPKHLPALQDFQSLIRLAALAPQTATSGPSPATESEDEHLLSSLLRKDAISMTIHILR